jgi:hypothetical protein
MFNFGEETQSIRFVIVGFTGRQRGTKIGTLSVHVSAHGEYAVVHT